MQFKVPQFLDIEDKIFGPFTFKEFIYLAGGAGLCFVLYKLLGLFLGAIPILASAALAIALARYRPNDKPFIDMIESAFNYALQNKLYIWKRRQVKIEGQKKPAIEATSVISRDTMRLNSSKLKDLAWSLDVLDFNKHVDIR